MKQLNVVIPGLLGPFSNEMPAHIKRQLKQSEFNVINKCFSRAEISNANGDFISSESASVCASEDGSYYQTLTTLLNPQCKLSLCQLTAEYDGIDTTSGFYYRADPVHFKAESDHAILIGPDFVSPEKDETRQLIDCFNQHFSEDKLSLHSTSEKRWYLRSDKSLNLEFNTLDYALGRDIKHFLPYGEDELWWRKILNEAQMLFFQHQVSQDRESRGQLSINGLWLWDCCTDFNCSDTHLPEQLFASDELAIALGRQAGITTKSIDDIDEIESTAVLVLDHLYESVCYGDVDAWFEALLVFCNSELQRVVNLLLSKKVDEIKLYPCNGQIFKIDRVKLLKFWKRNKTLIEYM